MESIGKRIKSRNKERIHAVNERKRKEMRAQARAAYKKQQQKRPPGYDSDIEELTPVINKRPSVQVSNKNKNPLRNIKSVKESFSRIFSKDLALGKSVASSSGVGNNSVASSSVIKGSAVEKQEIVILSDSESETEAEAKARVKQLSDWTTDGGDSENEDDNVTVVSLSTGSSSSSSSDDDLSSKDVVGDTGGDGDVDMRKARSPSQVRKPLGGYKRPASCLTRPVQEDKTKIQKLNHRAEQVEVVMKEQCNTLLICNHCGKVTIEIPDAQTRVEDDDMKQNKFEDSAPEKPSTSLPEMVNPETDKQVTTPEELSSAQMVNPPVDDESDYSMSSQDESEASLRVLDGSSEGVDLFRLLVNSVWQKEDRLGEDEVVSSVEEEEHSEEADQRRYDDDGLLIIRPPPLIENFGMEEPESPPEISERDKGEAKLWDEFEFCLNSENAGIKLSSTLEEEISTDESHSARCKKGYHQLYLDIEIGMKCINCGFVEREMRSLDEYEWGGRIPSGRRKTNRFEEEEEGSNNSFTGKVGFEAHEKNNLDDGCVSTEGTVWDKIPRVKSQMYLHQQEGFEFIWKNLAGTIMLNELKDFEKSDETGGCIMSHAPGTGKTRLTIMFLQAYLECFPTCKAVIIAPASLLLTWAEEFKKWNIKVPFHNLGSLELTGKESKAALDLLMRKNPSARTTNEIRMVKLYSWIKSKSILGISYNLFEKLAGDKDVEAKKTKKVKPDYELLSIREILMGKPGLLVLDEAHTPRNQRSRIWKTLSKVETQKRILLSGTPFQNNFQELCNVLGLARPKYLEKLTSTLKNSGMKRGESGLGNVIEELKTVMLPFVHVHKGSILQKSLPGLRECVVVLNPPELQKKVLESIEVTHNVFETEHKLSLVSVHPSLVSRCKLTARESRTINEALLAQLKKVTLDPDQSVKTRFLMEFIGLCEMMKEKVLVFSQYIDPLELIMKHLVHRFNWKEEEDVLYMHGKLKQKQRQTLINEFNDPKSKAKVMLASTKACSEGINLVGASRVILLDVVWNPAVERQAISRAYRIGQKRIVYTYHLVAKGTPEGPKYCKQAHKDRISELVFAQQDKGNEKIDEAVTEDQVLDTMVKHKKLADMFDNLIVHPKEADLVNGFNILMP